MIIRFLFITLTCFISTFYIQANETEQISIPVIVMSYNIRVPVDKTPNDWQSRKALAWQVIETRQPDVIGFQEMVENQRDDLLANSSLYTAFGDGRDSDRTGESCTIFYLHDKWSLDQNDSGTFWYSSTPDVSGSMDWGNDYIRIATWVRLVNKESGQGFYVYNTHWDFLDDFQLKAVTLLTQKIAKRKYQQEPYIVMGDLNAVPNSPAIINLLKPNSISPMQDVWLAAQQSNKLDNVNDNSGFTFHGFSGQANRRIDYIFSSVNLRNVQNMEVVIDQKNGNYPSDHFPLMVELIF